MIPRRLRRVSFIPPAGALGVMKITSPEGKEEKGIIYDDKETGIRRPDAHAIVAVDDTNDKMNFVFITDISGNDEELKISGSHQGQTFFVRIKEMKKPDGKVISPKQEN
jgi:hypothetical protein